MDNFSIENALDTSPRALLVVVVVEDGPVSPGVLWSVRWSVPSERLSLSRT